VGRLFWKFFSLLWLAQFVTSIGVGAAIWALRPDPGPAPSAYGAPPPDGPLPGDRSILPPLMPLLAGSVVSLLFAAVPAWYFARPIRSLRGAFRLAAGGQLDTRIGASMGSRKDELADLGSEFDRMAERLEGLVDGQRRLLHDVSHELRSPLARLQAAADLLRQQPERREELVQRILRDTARMDLLVGELLTLARLDSGMTGDMSEWVDLRECIGGIAEDAQFEAGQRNGGVDVSVPESLAVRGNRDLLHRAIENVVRNALRHSPDGGKIGIAARREDSRPQLRIDVTDRGEGVPEADLEEIFAPFVRGAKADASPGYGLGLAIARRIVEAHGGTVDAANRAEGGLTVTMRLPVGERTGP
jgi:two-component system, OmpR family, sensor kinase